jgi:hypothetical protein
MELEQACPPDDTCECPAAKLAPVNLCSRGTCPSGNARNMPLCAQCIPPQTTGRSIHVPHTKHNCSAEHTLN